MQLAVFTSGRQDVGIIAPVLRELAATAGVRTELISGGLHIGRGKAGRGAPKDIEGYRVAASIPAFPDGDSDLAVARAAGETTLQMAETLVTLGSQALLLAGDRSETLAAALAATCLRLPIVHLHGGEESAGAIDNACRHALTKLAHLHCVAHADFRARLIAMGEREDRVHVTGAPALDQAWSTPLDNAEELARSLGRQALGHPLIVMTHHPTTIGGLSPTIEIAAVIDGVRAAVRDRPDALVVMTKANHDAGGGAINHLLAAQASVDSRFMLVDALGTRRYYSLLALADAMVGNSSSGILEAPTFSLPVVNVGERQRGRLRIGAVADAPTQGPAIGAALSRLLASPRAAGVPVATAYGDGHAAARVRAAIEAFAAEPAEARLDKTPRKKGAA